MGWAIGYDTTWQRDIGYGVPARCDHPGCNAEIDRGLSFVCGGAPYGGDLGCGLYFCFAHLVSIEETGYTPVCRGCADDEDPFYPTPDVAEWVNWKPTDESWAQWRAENPALVAEMQGARCDQ